MQRRFGCFIRQATFLRPFGRHTTCEAGKSWPLEFNLIKDHIGAAYFKDYKWEGRKLVTVPLGEGQVDSAYGKMLMKIGYSGPNSLHLEYLEGKPSDPAVLKEFRGAHGRDLKTLKWWRGVREAHFSGVVGASPEGLAEP